MVLEVTLGDCPHDLTVEKDFINMTQEIPNFKEKDW